MDTVSVDRGHIVRAAARHDPVVAGPVDDFLDYNRERKPMGWIAKVCAGDFAAIPANIDFASARDLADLVDGSDLAGGDERCCAIYARVMKTLRQPIPCRQSPIDLWIAVDFAHRGYRGGGIMPVGGDELEKHNALARELRAALVRLTPAQKTGIMSVIAQRETHLPEAENSQSTAYSRGAGCT